MVERVTFPPEKTLSTQLSQTDLVCRLSATYGEIIQQIINVVANFFGNQNMAKYDIAIFLDRVLFTKTKIDLGNLIPAIKVFLLPALKSCAIKK